LLPSRARCRGCAPRRHPVPRLSTRW
jgi:hypothetical protein